jgi:opacity protein-like surface antigen
MKILLSLAAVGAMALTAAPAAAQHRDNHNWNNNGRGHHTSRSHHSRWSQGHRFGPRYSYTSYNSLPRSYRVRYHLSPRYRYVYTDGYIYQVDPTTYAITRILNALTGY